MRTGTHHRNTDLEMGRTPNEYHGRANNNSNNDRNSETFGQLRCVLSQRHYCTLCYVIVIPARKSAFRTGFWPACYRESTEIGPPAGRRPAGGPISVLSRSQAGHNPVQKADLRPGSTIAQHRVFASVIRSVCTRGTAPEDMLGALWCDEACPRLRVHGRSFTVRALIQKPLRSGQGP